MNKSEKGEALKRGRCVCNKERAGRAKTKTKYNHILPLCRVVGKSVKLCQYFFDIRGGRVLTEIQCMCLQLFF